LSTLHRVLLRLFPHDFREDDGDELAEFWSAQSTEARYQGLLGRARYAGAITADAIRAAARARARSGAVGPPGIANSHGEGMMKTLLQDVRYARRALTGAPLFTTIAALTLSFGIGATTAVYSVVSSVALAPLPYPNADRLMDVRRAVSDQQPRGISWPDFRDWRERGADFIALAACAEGQSAFEWDGGAEVLSGAHVTRDFFEVMGVDPELGRVFSAEEDIYQGAEAVVLSHGLWVERFGANPDILGTTVPLDGELVPVVGVMPAGFDAPMGDTRFWQPLQGDEILEAVGLTVGGRGINFLTMVGRLAPDVARVDAEQRLRAVASTLDDEVGRVERLRAAPALLPLLESVVGDIESTLFMILAAACLVLVVASANAAGLALSRAAARERELAVRIAVGAGRGRLARQLLTEAGMLAGAAGIAGIGIAWALQQALLRLAPPGVPRIDSVSLDSESLLFAATAAAMSGLLFGTVPALRSPPRAPAAALAGGRGMSAGRHSLRPQRFLVTFQVAVSVVLLAAAVLLGRSFARLTAVDLGFEPQSIMVATIQPADSRYGSPQELDAFYAQVLERVRRLPDVRAASTTYSPPLVDNGFSTSIYPEGSEPDPENPFMAGTVIVRDGYFETNGISIVAGRAFDGSERLDQPPVVIVSESLADRLWPGEDPIGKRFVWGHGLRGSADSFDNSFFPDEPYTVIGVAADVRRDGPTSELSLEYYRPHQQITWGFQYLMVRTTVDAASLASALREAVWSVDPSVPVRTIRTLDSHLSESVAAPRFRMLLVGGFAGLTCLLAMVGLYAVMWLAVTRRTREMGIRLALGAHPGSVVYGVLAGGMRLVLTGAAFGLAVAVLANRTLSEMLFQLQPTDPVTYAAVGLLVAGVAGLACYGPARRAGRVDPVRSLREE
jgi:putative ABC transport system permease protein